MTINVNGVTTNQLTTLMQKLFSGTRKKAQTEIDINTGE